MIRGAFQLAQITFSASLLRASVHSTSRFRRMRLAGASGYSRRSSRPWRTEGTGWRRAPFQAEDRGHRRLGVDLGHPQGTASSIGPRADGRRRGRRAPARVLLGTQVRLRAVRPAPYPPRRPRGDGRKAGLVGWAAGQAGGQTRAGGRRNRGRAAEALRQRRIELEERRARGEKERQRAEEKRQRRDEEQRPLRRLQEMSRSWAEATSIRAFVDAVERAGQARRAPERALKAWVTEAREAADRLDPLPLVLAEVASWGPSPKRETETSLE